MCMSWSWPPVTFPFWPSSPSSDPLTQWSLIPINSSERVTEETTQASHDRKGAQTARMVIWRLQTEHVLELVFCVNGIEI